MSKKSLLLVAILTIFPFSYASAAQMRAPSDSGSVVIESTENDVYTTGASVTQNGTLTGDLIAAGGTVTMTGNVTQDVMAAGGTLSIIGRIEGDARLAGGTVLLNAPVGEDVLAVGGTVSLSETARVGKDLFIAAGNVSISSEVGGDVHVAGGEIYINSPIMGSVDVRSQRLTFGPRAQVRGKITYRGEQEAVIQQGAVVSPVEFIKDTKQTSYRAGWRGVSSVTGFMIGMLALFLVALSLWKVGAGAVALLLKNVEQSPWKSLGIGFLGGIVTPIASVILLITVIGSYLAGVIGLTFALSLLIAYATSSIFLGALLMKWIKKTPALTLSWSALVLGVVVFSLLGIIPIIGWLINGVITLMVFGGIMSTLYASMKRGGGAVTRV